jgi:hypothetical protein
MMKKGQLRILRTFQFTKIITWITMVCFVLTSTGIPVLAAEYYYQDDQPNVIQGALQPPANVPQPQPPVSLPITIPKVELPNINIPTNAQTTFKMDNTSVANFKVSGQYLRGPVSEIVQMSKPANDGMPKNLSGNQPETVHPGLQVASANLGDQGQSTLKYTDTKAQVNFDPAVLTGGQAAKNPVDVKRINTDEIGDLDTKKDKLKNNEKQLNTAADMINAYLGGNMLQPFNNGDVVDTKPAKENKTDADKAGAQNQTASLGSQLLNVSVSTLKQMFPLTEAGLTQAMKVMAGGQTGAPAEGRKNLPPPATNQVGVDGHAAVSGSGAAPVENRQFLNTDTAKPKSSVPDLEKPLQTSTLDSAASANKLSGTDHAKAKTSDPDVHLPVAASPNAVSSAGVLNTNGSQTPGGSPAQNKPGVYVQSKIKDDQGHDVVSVANASSAGTTGVNQAVSQGTGASNGKAHIVYHYNSEGDIESWDSYDTLGRLVKSQIESPDNYNLDAALQGSIAAHVPTAFYADGSSATFVYNADGTTTVTLTSHGKTGSYEDGEYNITASASTSVRTYNDKGQLVSELKYITGMPCLFTYNPGTGRIESFFNQVTGETKTYGYDESGYLTSVKDKNGNSVNVALPPLLDQRDAKYQFSSDGSLLCATSKNGQRCFYDWTGKIIQFTDVDGQVITATEWDANGHVIRGNGSEDGEMYFKYNEAGYLSGYYKSGEWVYYSYGNDGTVGQASHLDKDGKTWTDYFDNGKKLFTIKDGDITVNGSKVTDAQAKTIISTYFQKMLGREAAPDEIDHWVAACKSGDTYSFSEMTKTVKLSEEYLTKTIKDAYTQTLGRGASEDEIASVMSQIRSGQIKTDELNKTLEKLPEFVNGAMFDKKINELYNRYLRRDAAADEIKLWRDFVISGKYETSDIESQIKTSGEYKSEVASTSAMADLAKDYLGIKNATMEDFKKWGWVDAEGNSRYTINELANGLKTSDVYLFRVLGDANNKQSDPVHWTKPKSSGWGIFSMIVMVVVSAVLSCFGVPPILLGMLMGALNAAINGGNILQGAIMGAITSVAATAVSAIASAVEAGVSAVSSGANVMDAMTAKLGASWDSLTGGFSDFATNLSNGFANVTTTGLAATIVKGIVIKVGGVMAQKAGFGIIGTALVSLAVGALANAAGGAVSGASSSAPESGLVSGFMNGLTQSLTGGQGLAGFITNAVTKIASEGLSSVANQGGVLGQMAKALGNDFINTNSAGMTSAISDFLGGDTGLAGAGVGRDGGTGQFGQNGNGPQGNGGQGVSNNSNTVADLPATAQGGNNGLAGNNGSLGNQGGNSGNNGKNGGETGSGSGNGNSAQNQQTSNQTNAGQDQNQDNAKTNAPAATPAGSSAGGTPAQNQTGSGKAEEPQDQRAQNGASEGGAPAEKPQSYNPQAPENNPGEPAAEPGEKTAGPNQPTQPQDLGKPPAGSDAAKNLDHANAAPKDETLGLNGENGKKDEINEKGRQNDLIPPGNGKGSEDNGGNGGGQGDGQGDGKGNGGEKENTPDNGDEFNLLNAGRSLLGESFSLLVTRAMGGGLTSWVSNYVSKHLTEAYMKRVLTKKYAEAINGSNPQEDIRNLELETGVMTDEIISHTDMEKSLEGLKNSLQYGSENVRNADGTNTTVTHKGQSTYSDNEKSHLASYQFGNGPRVEVGSGTAEVGWAQGEKVTEEKYTQLLTGLQTMLENAPTPADKANLYLAMAEVKQGLAKLEGTSADQLDIGKDFSGAREAAGKEQNADKRSFLQTNVDLAEGAYDIKTNKLADAERLKNTVAENLASQASANPGQCIQAVLNMNNLLQIQGLSANNTGDHQAMDILMGKALSSKISDLDNGKTKNAQKTELSLVAQIGSQAAELGLKGAAQQAQSALLDFSDKNLKNAEAAQKLEFSQILDRMASAQINPETAGAVAAVQNSIKETLKTTLRADNLANSQKLQAADLLNKYGDQASAAEMLNQIQDPADLNKKDLPAYHQLKGSLSQGEEKSDNYKKAVEALGDKPAAGTPDAVKSYDAASLNLLKTVAADSGDFSKQPLLTALAGNLVPTAESMTQLATLGAQLASVNPVLGTQLLETAAAQVGKLAQTAEAVKDALPAGDKKELAEANSKAAAQVYMKAIENGAEVKDAAGANVDLGQKLSDAAQNSHDAKVNQAAAEVLKADGNVLLAKGNIDAALNAAAKLPRAEKDALILSLNAVLDDPGSQRTPAEQNEATRHMLGEFKNEAYAGEINRAAETLKAGESKRFDNLGLVAKDQNGQITVQQAAGTDTTLQATYVKNGDDITLTELKTCAPARGGQVLQDYKVNGSTLELAGAQKTFLINLPGGQTMPMTTFVSENAKQPQDSLISRNGSVYQVTIDPQGRTAPLVQTLYTKPPDGVLGTAALPVPDIRKDGEGEFKENGAPLNFAGRAQVSNRLASLGFSENDLDHKVAGQPISLGELINSGKAYLASDGTLFIDRGDQGYLVVGQNAFPGQNMSLGYIAQVDGQDRLRSVNLSDKSLLDNITPQGYQLHRTDEATGNQYDANYLRTSDGGVLASSTLTLTNLGGVVLSYDAKGNLTNRVALAGLAAGAGCEFKEVSGGFVLSQGGVATAFTDTGRGMPLPGESGSGGGQQKVMEFDVVQKLNLSIVKLRGQIEKLSTDTITKETVTLQLSGDSITKTLMKSDVFDRVQNRETWIDSAGMLSVNQPAGGSIAREHYVDLFNYDASGVCTGYQRSGEKSGVTELARNAAGEVVRKETYRATYMLEFNGAGKIVRSMETRSNVVALNPSTGWVFADGKTMVSQVEYHYDTLGNLTGSTRTDTTTGGHDYQLDAKTQHTLAISARTNVTVTSLDAGGKVLGSREERSGITVRDQANGMMFSDGKSTVSSIKYYYNPDGSLKGSTRTDSTTGGHDYVVDSKTKELLVFTAGKDTVVSILDAANKVISSNETRSGISVKNQTTGRMLSEGKTTVSSIVYSYQADGTLLGSRRTDTTTGGRDYQVDSKTKDLLVITTRQDVTVSNLDAAGKLISSHETRNGISVKDQTAGVLLSEGKTTVTDTLRNAHGTFTRTDTTTGGFDYQRIHDPQNHTIVNTLVTTLSAPDVTVSKLDAAGNLIRSRETRNGIKVVNQTTGDVLSQGKTTVTDTVRNANGTFTRTDTTTGGCEYQKVPNAQNPAIKDTLVTTLSAPDVTVTKLDAAGNMLNSEERRSGIKVVNQTSGEVLSEGRTIISNTTRNSDGTFTRRDTTVGGVEYQTGPPDKDSNIRHTRTITCTGDTMVTRLDADGKIQDSSQTRTGVVVTDQATDLATRKVTSTILSGEHQLVSNTTYHYNAAGVLTGSTRQEIVTGGYEMKTVGTSNRVAKETYNESTISTLDNHNRVLHREGQRTNRADYDLDGNLVAHPAAPLTLKDTFHYAPDGNLSSRESVRGNQTTTTTTMMIGGKNTEVAITAESGKNERMVSIDGNQYKFDQNVSLQSVGDKLVVTAGNIRQEFDSAGTNITGRGQGAVNSFYSLADTFQAGEATLATAQAGVWSAKSFSEFVSAEFNYVKESIVVPVKEVVATALLVADVAGKALGFVTETAINVLAAPQAQAYFEVTGKSFGAEAIHGLTNGLGAAFDWIETKAIQPAAEWMLRGGDKLTAYSEYCFTSAAAADNLLTKTVFAYAGLQAAEGAILVNVTAQNLSLVSILAVSAVFPVAGSVLGTLMLSKDAMRNGLGSMAQSFFVDPFTKVGSGILALGSAFAGSNQEGISAVRGGINAMTEIGGGVVGLAMAWMMVKGAVNLADAARMDVLLKDGSAKLQDMLKNPDAARSIQAAELPGMKLGALMERVLDKEPGAFKDAGWADKTVGDLRIQSGEGFTTIADMAAGAKGLEALTDFIKQDGFKLGELKMETPAPSEGLLKQSVDAVKNRAADVFNLEKPPSAPATVFRGLNAVIKAGDIGMRFSPDGLGVYLKTFTEGFVTHQVDQFVQAAKGVGYYMGKIADLKPLVTEFAQAKGFVRLASESESGKAALKSPEGSPARSDLPKGNPAQITAMENKSNAADAASRSLGDRIKALDQKATLEQQKVVAAEASLETAKRELSVLEAQVKNSRSTEGSVHGASGSTNVKSREMQRGEAKVAALEKTLEQVRASQNSVADYNAKAKNELSSRKQAADLTRADAQAALKVLKLEARLDTEANVSADPAKAEEQRNQAGDNIRILKAELSLEKAKISALDIGNRIADIDKKASSDESQAKLESLLAEQKATRQDLKTAERDLDKAKLEAGDGARQRDLRNALSAMKDSSRTPQERALQRAGAMRLEAGGELGGLKVAAAETARKIQDLETQMAKTPGAADFLDLLKQKGELQRRLQTLQGDLSAAGQKLNRARGREAEAEAENLLGKAFEAPRANGTFASKAELREAIQAVKRLGAEADGQPSLARAITKLLAETGEVSQDIMQMFQGQTGLMRLRALARQGLEPAVEKVLTQMCVKAGINDGEVLDAVAKELQIDRSGGQTADAWTVDQALAQLFGIRPGIDLSGEANLKTSAKELAGLEGKSAAQTAEAMARGLSGKAREALAEAEKAKGAGTARALLEQMTPVQYVELQGSAEPGRVIAEMLEKFKPGGERLLTGRKGSEAEVELGTLTPKAAVVQSSSVAAQLARGMNPGALLKRSQQIQDAQAKVEQARARLNRTATLNELKSAVQALEKAELALAETRFLAKIKPAAGANIPLSSEFSTRRRVGQDKTRIAGDFVELDKKLDEVFTKMLEAASAETRNEIETKEKAPLDLAREQLVNELLNKFTNLNYTFMDVNRQDVREEIFNRVDAARKDSNFQPRTLNDRIIKELAVTFKENAELFLREKGIVMTDRYKQIAFAYKVAEHVLLTAKLAGRPEIKAMMGGEALRLAAGYGKEDGNGMGLITAYNILKAETGRAPKLLFATSAPDLVDQMMKNPLVKSMGDEVVVVGKDTAISDPSKGGIYLMDQKTCQEVLLEAKGGNKAKEEFLKSFDAGSVDEIQAALSSTPVIHGVSGEILDEIFQKLPDASVRQVRHQAELRIAAMTEVMKAFQAAGGDLRTGKNFDNVFVNREIKRGESQRQSYALNDALQKDVVKSLRKNNADLFKDISSDEINRMCDMGADVIMKIEGTDYSNEWTEAGVKFNYHVMGNGTMMRNTVFGDSEMAAMVAVKEVILGALENGKAKSVDAAVGEMNGDNLTDIAKRLLHFKTGEATFLEMMSYVGKEKFIVGSATVEGNYQGLKNLGFRISSLTEESTLSMEKQVVIESMQINGQDSMAGEPDQLVFKSGGTVYEMGRDGQFSKVSAQDYLVRKLMSEMGEFNAQLVTDISNGKNETLRDNLVRTLENSGVQVNSISGLDELAAHAKQAGTDVILISGYQAEVRAAMIDAVKDLIKADPGKKRIILGMGIGEGSNLLAESNHGKYRAAVWKTNLEAYDKTAQTARRINAPGRTEGRARVFVDLEEERNFTGEERQAIKDLIAKGQMTEARDEIIKVSKKILSEIDYRQAEGIRNLLGGVSTSDVVEMVEKQGKPTEKEMQAYLEKSLSLIEGMEARSQGLEKVIEQTVRAESLSQPALKAAVREAQKQGELLNSYHNHFLEQANQDASRAAEMMVDKFGATWQLKLELAKCNLTPDNYKRDYAVAGAHAFLKLPLVIKVTNYVKNQASAGVKDFFVLRQAEKAVAAQTKVAQADKQAADKLGEAIAAGSKMVYYQGEVLTKDRAEAEQKRKSAAVKGFLPEKTPPPTGLGTQRIWSQAVPALASAVLFLGAASAAVAGSLATRVGGRFMAAEAGVFQSGPAFAWDSHRDRTPRVTPVHSHSGLLLPEWLRKLAGNTEPLVAAETLNELLRDRLNDPLSGDRRQTVLFVGEQAMTFAHLRLVATLVTLLEMGLEKTNLKMSDVFRSINLADTHHKLNSLVIPRNAAGFFATDRFIRAFMNQASLSLAAELGKKNPIAAAALEKLKTVKMIPLLAEANKSQLPAEFIRNYVLCGDALRAQIAELPRGEQKDLLDGAYAKLKAALGKEYTEEDLNDLSSAVLAMENDGGPKMAQAAADMARNPAYQDPNKREAAEEQFFQQFGITLPQYQKMEARPLGLRLMTAGIFKAITPAENLKNDPYKVIDKAGLRFACMGLALTMLAAGTGMVLAAGVAGVGLAALLGPLALVLSVAGTGALGISGVLGVQRDDIAWKANPTASVMHQLESGNVSPEVRNALLGNDQFMLAVGALRVPGSMQVISEVNYNEAVVAAINVLGGEIKAAGKLEAQIARTKELVAVLRALHFDVISEVKHTTDKLNVQLTPVMQPAQNLMLNGHFDRSLQMLNSLGISLVVPPARWQQDKPLKIKSSDSAA